MKTTSTFLLALALGLASLSTASAGLITDPLSVQAPISDQGLATDPLGQGGPLPGPKPPVNVSAAAQFLASVIADGKTVRLSDLMLNPEFFAAAHAAGPEADALRGQIDWLMLSGVILGLDGDDGLDDLTGDAGDDFARHGGPDHLSDVLVSDFSFGSTQSLGFSFGSTNAGFSDGDTQVLHRPTAPTLGIILGGPGSDNLTPYIHPDAIQPPTPGIILGGPGGDTIILGGTGGDTFIPTGTFYIPPTQK